MPCNVTFTVISPGAHCPTKSSTGYQNLMAHPQRLRRFWVAHPCGSCKGDDMRQAPPCLGRCMLARIVLEPFGMEPSRRRPCQFISELIFMLVPRPSVGVTLPTG